MDACTNVGCNHTQTMPAGVNFCLKLSYHLEPQSRFSGDDSRKVGLPALQEQWLAKGAASQDKGLCMTVKRQIRPHGFVKLYGLP